MVRMTLLPSRGEGRSPKATQREGCSVPRSSPPRLAASGTRAGPNVAP